MSVSEKKLSYFSNFCEDELEKDIFSQLSFCFFLHLQPIAEPSPLYDNHHYHEECLRCNSCAINLTGVNQKRARRFKNQILCDLHFAGEKPTCLVGEQSLKLFSFRFFLQTLRSWNVLISCSNYAVLNHNRWDPS